MISNTLKILKFSKKISGQNVRIRKTYKNYGSSNVKYYK